MKALNDVLYTLFNAFYFVEIYNKLSNIKDKSIKKGGLYERFYI